MENIILTGMSGSGKSTIGEVLARTMEMPFIDTDLIIQARENRLLQDIVNRDGISKFLKIEKNAVLSLNCHRSVVATGGSVVLSPKAMVFLRRIGTIIYLRLDISEIEKRIENIETRGIVIEEGKSLNDVFHQRAHLYEKYSDLTVDCSNKGVEDIVNNISKYIKYKYYRLTNKYYLL